jgi:hypothetical protein
LAKEEYKTKTLEECAIRAHPKATTNMASAKCEEPQIPQDQSAIILFTMKDNKLFSENAKE